MNINPPPLPGVRNKRFKKALLWLGIFCIVIIGGLSLFNMIAGRDIPPPDTTDLIPERVELPADSNAFTFFILATNSIIWPTNATFVTGYLDGKPVTDEVIQETISLNTNMMILVEKGLACQRCIPPEL